MLEKIISLLTGLEVEDEVINALIEICKNEIKTYCRIEDDKKIEAMESTIIEMVIFKYNQLGSAGLSSENYSSASFVYMSDYPENIKNILNQNRRIKLL